MIKEISQVINDIGFCVISESDTTLIGGSNIEKYDFGVAHINEPRFHISLIDDKYLFKIQISPQKYFIKSFNDKDELLIWFRENYPKIVKLTNYKRISLLRLDRYDKLCNLVKYLGEGRLE